MTASPSLLSPREIETVLFVCAGKSNKEIAGEMAISVRTVEAYRAAVRDRLGIHSTGELILWAVRNHLVNA